MNREAFLDVLTRLLKTHSPSGQEEEIDTVLIPEFERTCGSVTRDEAGNLIGRVRGRGEQPPVRIMAHKDEIGVVVKRVEADGRLALDRLGGSFPWRYGEGPMDVLADSGVLTGILSAGASHVSEESASLFQLKTGRALTWDLLRIDLKMPRSEVLARGVRPGTRAVVSRARKKPTLLGEYVAAWALDNKGALAVMISVMESLSGSTSGPSRDTYFIASAGEEIGVSGGAFAARSVPGEALIALDVAPVATEYGIENTAQPVLLYKDAHSFYHKGVTDELHRLAATLGFGCQSAVLSSYGSDASYSHRYGYTGKPVGLCFAVENTHGYEIARVEGMENAARLLTRYLGVTDSP
ncbi:MAG: M42 family peptidase [Planctomycetes bacterium]|nr:M42 family peptidase [Planctomycetota bacterium]